MNPAVCLQDALGVDAFNCSSEALVADALFDAYRSADEASIRKLITTKPIFLDLDNQVNTLISVSANFLWQWQPVCQTTHVSVCLPACMRARVCNCTAHHFDVRPGPQITSSCCSLLDLQPAPLLQGWL